MGVCAHVCVCICVCMCVCGWWGLETPGVAALHSIPKMCACICHHVCVHLPVFQGRSARASKRQLRVSLEGPPGVFAPVVEQWGGKAQGQQLSSVSLHGVKPFIWLDSPISSLNVTLL